MRLGIDEGVVRLGIDEVFVRFERMRRLDRSLGGALAFRRTCG